MRIKKGKYGAVVVLGRKSALTCKQTSDGRDIDSERKKLRDVAETFCQKHNLDNYEVYACAAHGGFTVDAVDLSYQ